MSATWLIVWGVVALLVAIICLIAWALLKASPAPKKPDVVWHQLPPFRGDRTMSCCGRTPEEVPIYDMLTPKPEQVTCGRPDAPQRPRRAA
jgi:hypothetical protein